MNYTLQKELDVGGFGARWGCYATSLINIVEHELHRALTDKELDEITGQWFRLRLVNMSNYKNHETAGANHLDPDRPGWDEDADPEWHWWVLNRRASLLIAMSICGIHNLIHEYETHILATPGRHYVTYVVDENITINPDLSLRGKIIEKRRIEV